MKEKKGFISTSIIYSFFLVFILLMIAFLMSFVNKRYLIGKINDNLEIETEVYECTKGNSLRECLFKNEYIEYKEDNAGVIDFSKTQALANAKFREDSIKKAIEAKGKPNFNEAATKEEGMFAAEDDYGMSYYYRGAEDDNYVVFADQIWQIIRINGDGSIRMIYQGNWDTIKDLSLIDKIQYIKNNGYIDVDNNEELNGDDARHFSLDSKSEWKCNTYIMALKANISLADTFCENSYLKSNLLANINKDFCKWGEEQQKREVNKIETCGTDDDYSGATSLWHVGLMNNDSAKIVAESKVANEVPSEILYILYYWYSEYIDSKSDYLSGNTHFCGNKDINFNYNNFFPDNVVKNYCYCYNGKYENIIQRGDINICGGSLGTCSNNFGYEGIQIDYHTKSSVKLLKNNISLECPKNSNSTFGTNVNSGKLDYPIGLITSSELIIAGVPYSKINEEFYLSSKFDYWTSDLAFGDANLGYAYYFALKSGKLSVIDDDKNVAYIKPVINLNKCVRYTSGTGTINDPYIVEETEETC